MSELHHATADQQRSRLRAGFLVIGRKRPGFDAQWAQQMEQAAWQALSETGIEAVRPETRAVDDATLRAALGQLRRAECRVLIVLQPSMGDGRLAAVLAQQAGLPVVLWATVERPKVGKVSSCSLVGTHLFASLFAQWRRPFELVYGHPNEQATCSSLFRALQVATAADALRRSKVGQVGNPVPGFLNLAVDPADAFDQLGVVVGQFDLQQWFELVENQPPEKIAADVESAEAMGLPMEEGLGSDELARNSRCYLATRQLLQEENLDAVALRCWPEVPRRLGCWPYLAMARLGSENRIVALEGDVDGAICCLVGRLLGAGPGWISDWVAHDECSITLWHPGQAPFQFCQRASLRLARHFNNRLPLVVDGVLESDQPITLVRLWRREGRYRMMARNARTAPPGEPLAGTSGLAVFEQLDVPQWFDTLCHEGMPHHVVVFQGHHAATFHRVARWLNLPVVASW